MSLFKARPWYFIWEKAGMNGEKESIIIKLKENGCRITKQRKMILDISWKTGVPAARKFMPGW